MKYTIKRSKHALAVWVHEIDTLTERQLDNLLTKLRGMIDPTLDWAGVVDNNGSSLLLNGEGRYARANRPRNHVRPFRCLKWEAPKSQKLAGKWLTRKASALGFYSMPIASKMRAKGIPSIAYQLASGSAHLFGPIAKLP